MLNILSKKEDTILIQRERKY